MIVDVQYLKFRDSKWSKLFIPLGWRKFLAWQYENGRTEKFHLFKIVWQQISRNAYRPGLTKNPRHFILILCGRRVIESVICQSGFYVSLLGRNMISINFGREGWILEIKVLESVKQ